MHSISFRPCNVTFSWNISIFSSESFVDDYHRACCDIYVLGGIFKPIFLSINKWNFSGKSRWKNFEIMFWIWNVCRQIFHNTLNKIPAFKVLTFFYYHRHWRLMASGYVSFYCWHCHWYRFDHVDFVKIKKFNSTSLTGSSYKLCLVNVLVD